MEGNNEVLSDNNNNSNNNQENINILPQNNQPFHNEVEDESISFNFCFFLILFISLLLVLINSIEVYSLSIKWFYMKVVPSEIFEQCYKYNLSFKTVNCTISFLASISCLIFSLFLSFNQNWFIDVCLKTYLHYNFLVFGPYTLGFCVLGLWNWEKVVYLCEEGEDLNEKYISFSNVVTLFMLTVLSFTITVSVMLYSITCLYIQSVIGKDDGSDIIRFLFRKIVIRNNNPIEFYRMIDNRNNNNNVIDV